MLITQRTPGLGSSDDAHDQAAQAAMGQVRQRLAATQSAQSCGARLDQMYLAYYHLGAAQAHVDSMTGPLTYAAKALVQVLRHDVDNTWRAVRVGCRL